MANVNIIESYSKGDVNKKYCVREIMYRLSRKYEITV